MRLRRLWLRGFRSWADVELEAPDGLCVLRGPNGVGKSNLLEAIGYLATLRSFRGAPADALVADGEGSAVVRGEVEHDGRVALIEAEITRAGRNRAQVNRQRLRRTADLLEVVRVTVFSPDDLELVKGGPGGRREALDDLLVALHPRNDTVRAEWERVLRQRNALLKQVGGRLDDAAEVTLAVWDSKAADSGSELADLRQALVRRLGPSVQQAYRDLSGGADLVEVTYRRSWAGPLGEAIAASRADELRRGLTLIGPHRDELGLVLNGLPARTHASQGEQRCLALALRLAGHRELTAEAGSPPILLLDDVFSELDHDRSAALLDALPIGQAFLSTAGSLPGGARPAAVFEVGAGTLARGG